MMPKIHAPRPIQVKPGPTGWILVELPYTPERVQKIKTISGRTWQENQHCWAIPQTRRTIERLKALFSGDQIHIDPQLQKAKPKPAGWQPPIRVSPGIKTDLIRIFTTTLQQEAYRPHTIKIYTLHARRFLKTLKKSPTEIAPQDIQYYLHTLHTQDRATETYHNQAIRALKSFCKLALRKKPEFLTEAFPPRQKRL